MIAGIILAGGQSRRMGRDKALMTLGSQSLLERVRVAMTEVCDELVLVTNAPEKYASFGMRMVPDVFPGAGSLGGLYSGLAASSSDMAVAVACDMPFLNVRLLRFLAAAAEGYDAVVPDTSVTVGEIGDLSKAKQLELHPLHAVYRRTCLPFIEQRLKADDLRVMGFYSEVRIRYVRRAELAEFDPQFHSFINVNTPEEWADAEKLAASS
jgi:molybdopterin-guanine dinucleotide biosynthesis protein A